MLLLHLLEFLCTKKHNTFSKVFRKDDYDELFKIDLLDYEILQKSSAYADDEEQLKLLKIEHQEAKEKLMEELTIKDLTIKNLKSAYIKRT